MSAWFRLCEAYLAYLQAVSGLASALVEVSEVKPTAIIIALDD